MTDQFSSGGDPAPGSPDTGRYVVFVSAAVLLVASLLTLYEIDLGLEDEEADLGTAMFGGLLETSWKVWSDAWSIFPLVPIVLVLALVGAAWLAAEHANGMNVPDRVLGVPAADVRVILGVLAILTMAAYVLRTFMAGGDEALGLGVGGWLLLAGSIGYLVGAILDRRGAVHGGVASAAPDPSAPSSLVIFTSAVVVLVASFLPAVGASGLFSEGGNETETLNAWGEGFRPVYGLPAVAAVVVVMLLLIHQRGTAQAPIGIGSAVWRWAFSGFALLCAISLLIGNPVFGSFGNFIDVEFGQYLTLLGAVGLVAGCFMERSVGQAGPGTAPPTTF